LYLSLGTKGKTIFPCGGRSSNQENVAVEGITGSTHGLRDCWSFWLWEEYLMASVEDGDGKVRLIELFMTFILPYVLS